MKQVELVGILNLTPDSFSDGGLYFDVDDAVERTLQMRDEGAAIIDIGAESTRPGATPISADEEWRRLEPVLLKLEPITDINFSIDTYHPETVLRAADLFGHFIVNDVTGMNNPKMIEAVVETGLPCIISHLPGAYGQDIQAAHKGDLVDSEAEVYDDLLAKRAALMTQGVNGSEITLDPGFGFGKTPELNIKLLEFARLVPGIDVMIGYSQKKSLGEHRKDLETNLSAGRIAIAAGARYLRVHDVAGHMALLNELRSK